MKYVNTDHDFAGGEKVEFDYNGQTRLGTVDERSTDASGLTIRLRRPQFEKRSGRNLTHKRFVRDKINGQIVIVAKFSS